jgi:hypothetical protein
MTVQQMIIEVYENSTQNSELDPYTAGAFDITSNGAVKCLGYLNRAYEFVCSYKEQNGRPLRFEELKGISRFQLDLEEGTCQAGSTTADIVLAATASAVDDYYNGWVVYLDDGTNVGEYRVIVDYVGTTTTATVNRAWTTAPADDTTYDLYKNFYSLNAMNISPQERVFGILKCWDLHQRAEVWYGSRDAEYIQNLETAQVPTEYVFKRDQLIFNYPYNEARWYEVEYYTLPDELGDPDGSPVIPEGFHQAMIFYANYLDSLKQVDAETITNWYRAAINTIRTQIVDNDVGFSRRDQGFIIDSAYNRRY